MIYTCNISIYQVERLRDQAASALKQQRSHHQQQQQQQQQQQRRASGDRSNRFELGELEREGGREPVALVEQERGTGRGLGRMTEWIQEEECGVGESGVRASSPSSREGGGVGNLLTACEGTAAVAVIEAGGGVGTSRISQSLSCIVLYYRPHHTSDVVRIYSMRRCVLECHADSAYRCRGREWTV
jgi:hypothetical protein